MANEFRTTPQLGPALDDHDTQFYWDSRPTTFVNAAGTVNDGVSIASYKPGNRESGSDGHVYILVKAHADIASGNFSIDEATWLTKTGTDFTLPADILAAGGVKKDEWFHAKKVAL